MGRALGFASSQCRFLHSRPSYKHRRYVQWCRSWTSLICRLLLRWGLSGNDNHQPQALPGSSCCWQLLGLEKPSPPKQHSPSASAPLEFLPKLVNSMYSVASFFTVFDQSRNIHSECLFCTRLINVSSFFWLVWSTPLCTRSWRSSHRCM